MRSNSRASTDIFRAMDGYARAMTALISMPARWASDFTSAFEAATCRSGHDSCCDPCPPPCNDSCDDQCEPGCSCDRCSSSCAPSCGACSCGGRGCSKCGHGRRLEVGSWVEMSGGRVAVVTEIEDCYVKVTFNDQSDGEPQQYTKSSIRRVLQPPISVGARVLTKLGMVGTIKKYEADARIVTINLLGQDIQIDKCLICEVLPPDQPKIPQPTSPTNLVAD